MFIDMKLFFDARFIRVDHHDGISLFSTSLAKSVHDELQDDVTFLIYTNRQKKFLPEGAKTIKIHNPSSVQELFSGRIVAKYKPDVVYSPMQTIGKNKAYKLILTLHDMTYYKYRTPPKNNPFWIRVGWRLFHLTYVPQRLILNRADVIATVSETSKDEMFRAKLTKRPIIVISNAARSLSDFCKRPVQRDIPPKNIVFIGGDQKHKNIKTLILGMGLLPGKVLHLMSPISNSDKKRHQKIKPSGVEIVYHNGFDSKKEAKALANNAILVSASLAEGFGLPLVEAMDFGTPIAVSDIPIFHEVAGQAAKFFNPKSPSDFAKKVKELDDLKTRKKLVQKGMKQARKFNWGKSAKVLVAAAKELTGE